MIKLWFYLEACLDGERSKGLMNLALMFFKVGGGGIWRSILRPNPLFQTPLLSVCLGCIYKPTYYFFFLLFASFMQVTYSFYLTFIFHLLYFNKKLNKLFPIGHLDEFRGSIREGFHLY